MTYSINTLQKAIHSGFDSQTKAEEIMALADVKNRIVVITGGYAGIGLETTYQLAKAGAKVVVAARSLSKAHEALKGMQGIEILSLDLAVPKSIDDFASLVISKYSRIDLLINNAGIMAIPLARDTRGFEMQFATNHLGHFHLTSRLWPLLKKSDSARVVTLTSAGHRFSAVDLQDTGFNSRPYDKWAAYGQSKSANSLFSVELDRRGKAFGVRAFAVHPGRILDTDLGRHMSNDEMQAMLHAVKKENHSSQAYPTKTVEQGASTTLWCALSPQLENLGGVYCEDCDIASVVADDAQLPPGVKGWAVDQGAARSLWTLSEELLNDRFIF